MVNTLYEKATCSVSEESMKLFLSELQYVVAHLDQYAPQTSEKLSQSIETFYGPFYDGAERISYINPQKVFTSK